VKPLSPRFPIPPGSGGHGHHTASGILGVEAFKLAFWAQTVQAAGQSAVELFGQVRPGHGQRVVQVERQDPGSGAWQPVTTYGKSCDATTPQFLTDKAGVFLRAAPFQGATAYRLAWQNESGDWEWGAPIQVAAKADQPPPGILGKPLLFG